MKYENCLFCLLDYYLENNELYRHSVIINAGVLDGKRIGTVDVFDILVRITCIFSPVVGKVSHSPKWRMIYGQLGRNDQVVGIGLFARIGPVVCLT